MKLVFWWHHSKAVTVNVTAFFVWPKYVVFPQNFSLKISYLQYNNYICNGIAEYAVSLMAFRAIVFVK